MKGIVLAGGKSSRMGTDKALIKLGERSLIQYVIDSLSQVFHEVFISGNHPDHPDSRGIIKDIAEQKGPMGGIHSALECCGEDIFVCSCDMPFVSPGLIENMLQRREDGRINVARYGEKIYPVLGIYPHAFLDALTKSIEKGSLRMTLFLEQQNAHYIQYNEDFEHQFLSINTPENFRNAEIIINRLKNE